MSDSRLEKSLLETHCNWEVPTRFVKLVANSKGVTNLNLESTTFLSNESTSQIFVLLSTVKKIAQQCKREHIKKGDIINALKLCKFDHLYGHYSQMNYNIQSLNHSNVRLKGLMTYVDKEFDLESFLAQPPIKLPREIMIHGHWLAINGLVPEVSENISQDVEENVVSLIKSDLSSDIKIPISNIKTEEMNSVTQGTTIFSDNIPLPIERQVC